MILFVSVNISVAMSVFVRQMGNPLLNLAIEHELIEFVKMSQSSQRNRFIVWIHLKRLHLPILTQFRVYMAHLTVSQYCTFYLVFLLIIELLLCSIKFEHLKHLK